MGAGRLFHFLVAMPTSEDLFISAKRLLIYRSMYALADASGASAIDANHPPGWARRQKDSARPTRTAPPKATSGILSLRSPNRLWRTRRKSALFPHCCRIATFFVSSRCGLTAPYLATCAQEDFCLQQYRQDEHCQ